MTPDKPDDKAKSFDVMQKEIEANLRKQDERVAVINRENEKLKQAVAELAELRRRGSR
jgi:hypothetical protein